MYVMLTQELLFKAIFGKESEDDWLSRTFGALHCMIMKQIITDEAKND